MASERPDYILDLSSLAKPPMTPSGQASANADSSCTQRPWIAVHWKCCQTYSRIYRNAQATAYEGRCPKCGKPVRFRVGRGGTDSRFFEVR